MDKVIKNILLSFVAVFVLVAAFTYITDKRNYLQANASDAPSVATVQPAPVPQNPAAPAQSPVPAVVQPQPTQPIQDFQTGAESLLAVQVAPGGDTILFGKNETEQLPIASLTKLMTAMVVMDNYDLDQQVTIDQAAMDQEGEQGDLKLGQVLSVKNLLYIGLIESSNRAMYALSEVMGTQNFITFMNADAARLGLTNTHFADTTGLDAGSYSTAQDVAKLSEYVFEHYPLFGQITTLKQYNLYLDDGTFHHTLVNTDDLLGQVPGIVAGKTGQTDEAKGCLMIVQKAPQEGDYIIYVVLGAQDRSFEMESLIHWVGTHP